MNLELGISQYWENKEMGKCQYWVNLEKVESQPCGKLVTAKSHHWVKFETVKSQIGKKSKRTKSQHWGLSDTRKSHFWGKNLFLNNSIIGYILGSTCPWELLHFPKVGYSCKIPVQSHEFHIFSSIFFPTGNFEEFPVRIDHS